MAGLSRDQRRRLRVEQMIRAGVHPLTRGKARADLGTCGDCAFRQTHRHHTRTYPKCELGPVTRGEATDVRAAWPACDRFERSTRP